MALAFFNSTSICVASLEIRSATNRITTGYQFFIGHYRCGYFYIDRTTRRQSPCATCISWETIPALAGIPSNDFATPCICNGNPPSVSELRDHRSVDQRNVGSLNPERAVCCIDDYGELFKA